MVSRSTVEEVLGVLMKHLTQEQIREIVKDLRNVEGNKSFMQTVEALWNIVK